MFGQPTCSAARTSTTGTKPRCSAHLPHPRTAPPPTLLPLTRRTCHTQAGVRARSRRPRVWERRVSVSPSIVVITLPRFPVHSPRTPFGLRGDNLRTVTPETLFYKPKGISPTVPRYTVTPHLVDREPSVSMVDHLLPVGVAPAILLFCRYSLVVFRTRACLSAPRFIAKLSLFTPPCRVHRGTVANFSFYNHNAGTTAQGLTNDT